jgi:hypothetical protein
MIKYKWRNMGPKLLNLPADARFIIIGVIVLLVIAFRVLPLFISKNKRMTVLSLGAQREYGLAGGAICPNCHRPVVLSLLGIKLGFNAKLVRCEFCGKVSLMHRASPDALRAAEAAELADSKPAQPIPTKSEADKAQERIDESRYTNR